MDSELLSREELLELSKTQLVDKIEGLRGDINDLSTDVGALRAAVRATVGDDKGLLIHQQDVQTRIQDAADRVWVEAGGCEGDSSGSRYEAVCSSVASFLSCLSEDCLNSQEVVREAVGGLIMNLRSDMERRFPVNIRPRGLPKRKFTVEVTAYQPITTTVEVEATGPSEARALAEREASGDTGGHDWNAQDWDGDDVDGSTVTSDCCCNGMNHDGPCCPGWLRNADDGDINRCDECGRFASDDEAAQAAIASGG